MTVLVVAPHPDDETLGCGGTLLRRGSEGKELHWLIATRMTSEGGYDADVIRRRKEEIDTVGVEYGMSAIHRLDFPTAKLDAVPRKDLVEEMSEVFREVEPDEVYLPFRGDAHSDHAVVFDAAASCTKWFRSASVCRVLAYETLSETDQSLKPGMGGFRPNVYVDISGHLKRKLEIMSCFESEVGPHPFPRSDTGIESLARLRGAASGFKAAEAFLLLRERV